MTDMTDKINLSLIFNEGEEALSRVPPIDSRIRHIRHASLVGPAGKLEKAAAGWWTVAYTVPTKRTRRFDDGVDDDTGKKRYRYEIRDEVNLIVRGWRSGGEFLAAWSANRTDPGVVPSFKADCAYWWTREHEAWAELPRERVTWTTPHPTPVKVSFTELKRLLKS